MVSCDHRVLFPAGFKPVFASNKQRARMRESKELRSRDRNFEQMVDYEYRPMGGGTSYGAAGGDYGN